MNKEEIEKDTSKVSKKLEEAVGGKKMAEKVKKNSNEAGLIQC